MRRRVPSAGGHASSDDGVSNAVTVPRASLSQLIDPRSMPNPTRWLTMLLLSVALAPTASAIERCRVGQRVKAPGGPGTVVAIQNGGVGCSVHIDGRPAGLVEVYGAFMLDALDDEAKPTGTPAARPAAGAAPGAAVARGPAVGRYQCTSGAGGAGGNMVIRILSATRYANEQGTRGALALIGTVPDRPSITRFRFAGGPWDGYFGAVLDGGRIGLTSKATGTFYEMTCDRRGR